MSGPFREVVSAALPSAARLEATLHALPESDWQLVADIFAVRLPEFDALAALPGSETLAGLLARVRGVPLVGLESEPPLKGNVVLVASWLTSGEAALQLVEHLRKLGASPTLLVAAVEQTTAAARPQLTGAGLTVRALVQVAQTPTGLVFERRTPERWAS